MNAGQPRTSHSRGPRIDKKPRILIIGAGPTGLGAGWRLHELEHDDFVIYEKQLFPGGLATSHRDANGFTWDIGGHVLHSHYPYFDRVFEEVMTGEYFTHQRESWVWIADRFIPYPFQNNIHRLPHDLFRECLDGLRSRAQCDEKDIVSFADWILASFGAGIAKHFMLPYNRKVWAYPPEEMSWQWVGDRVATVDVSRIEANFHEGKDEISWGPNAVFHFPKDGGTGAIWRRIAARFEDHIQYGRSIVKIDAAKKKVYLHDGTINSYDLLLTSMPLDVFATFIPELTSMPMRLHYSDVSVVGLGIRGNVPEHLRTKCWLYFPEDITPFFRATVFSNYSQNNAPAGTWSLMTETASSTYRPLPEKDITEAVIYGARNAKILSKDSQIVSTWVFRTDHGYPTPTIGRDQYLSHALMRLEELDIYSRGRFGAWKYEVSNQDHSFMQGVEWVNRMFSGATEITLNEPASVNRR